MSLTSCRPPEKEAPHRQPTKIRDQVMRQKRAAAGAGESYRELARCFRSGISSCSTAAAAASGYSKVTWGPVTLARCTTAHPLHTKFLRYLVPRFLRRPRDEPWGHQRPALVRAWVVFARRLLPAPGRPRVSAGARWSAVARWAWRVSWRQPGVLAAQSRCWETSSSFPHPVTGRLDRGAPGVNPLYRAKVAEDLLQHGQTSGAKTTHDRAARAGGS